MMTAKNFWLWFGGIWLLVGSLFLVVGVSVGMHKFIMSDRLEKEGRTVEGMVLTKEIRRSSSKSGSSSNPSYYVTFRFVPPKGEIVHSEAPVPAAVWDTLEERGAIQVTYLPDQPQSHRIQGQSKDVVLPLVFGVLGGIVGSIGGFIVFNAVGTRRREKELVRSGVIAEATVTDIVPAYFRINGVSQLKLRYRFQDAQGKTREGSRFMSPEEAGNWLPGHTGTVRYDVRKPRVSIWIGKG